MLESLSFTNIGFHFQGVFFGFTLGFFFANIDLFQVVGLILHRFTDIVSHKIFEFVVLETWCFDFQSVDIVSNWFEHHFICKVLHTSDFIIVLDLRLFRYKF